MISLKSAGIVNSPTSVYDGRSRDARSWSVTKSRCHPVRPYQSQETMISNHQQPPWPKFKASEDVDRSQQASQWYRWVDGSSFLRTWGWRVHGKSKFPMDLTLKWSKRSKVHLTLEKSGIYGGLSRITGKSAKHLLNTTLQFGSKLHYAGGSFKMCCL